MVRERNKLIYYSLVTIFGFCVFFIGAGSLIGYIVESDTLSSWFGDTKMAVNTSICMVLTGVSLFLIGIDNLKK